MLVKCRRTVLCPTKEIAVRCPELFLANDPGGCQCLVKRRVFRAEKKANSRET